MGTGKSPSLFTTVISELAGGCPVAEFNVGESVGRMVVGGRDGIELGAIVIGAAIGVACVGELVMRVGNCVGNRVGSIVGSQVGLSVGRVVG